ncbi:cation-translocating P-type ATPase [Crateriforma conspicua]|uniref:Putative cation-transporting ATPase F n=1 Tax=Crateriforma conspicua TaxID=2527996 RepID=A0A5C6FRF3_9PLAN|nr:HAD-IC family P-type ATPase [Crateriforma conspicua]TWU64921.1 putative cation-transporting ATPase F [Crateriforma conspicua]
MTKPQTDIWYDHSADQVAQRLETDFREGLGLLEVGRRQSRFGPNQLTQKAADGWPVILLRQFQQPLVYILLGAVVLTLVMREWADAAVILAVVLVNASIGFVQEAKALKAIDALSQSLQTMANVIRGGQPATVDASELVPGDVVQLQSGDRVPADLRLVETKDLQIDESALTGESVPVEKQTSALPAGTVLAERTNVAYSTTLVTYGTATGIVVATGDRTEIGHINELIASADVLETPLVRRINELSHLLLKVILVLAVLVAVAGVIRGAKPVDVLLSAVALAVGAIPEGLPAVVTATLALGVARLASRRAIVRKLPAVETLGSTSVICSDKTGTLTQNQMTVRNLWADDRLFTATGSGYSPEGRLMPGAEGDADTGEPDSLDLDDQPVLAELMRAGLLCNDARLNQDGDGNWQVEGDPTEAALLVSAAKGRLERQQQQQRRPRLDVVPFESQHQYMATLHQADNETIVYLKGSVERVLARCDTTYSGQPVDVNSIERQVDALASKGQRVLAFAIKRFPADTRSLGHDDLTDGMQWLGLQGMIDPPRPEAIKAVAACQQAGIRVKMITGDHVGTAKAIAGQLGLNGKRNEGGLVGLTGAELEGMRDHDLIATVEDVCVFARVSPAQKLRLVEALQSLGHVTAMTGDGVNDAPALRQANIGVAMGITGTEVTKESADMILTDDNFASIEAAVEEGRGIYDNLIKFIAWTLPTNLGEAGIILVATLLGLQLPITPLQILWINMSTAVLLGATLAFEPKEADVMTRPPRRQDEGILTGPLIWRTMWVGGVLVLATYFVFAFKKSLGVDMDAARTAAVNVIVMGQAFYLLNCRSLHYSIFRIGPFRNPLLWAGILAMIGLQLAFTYLPFMNQVFESAPTTWRPWALAVAAGLLLHVLAELDKLRQRFAATKSSGSNV